MDTPSILEMAVLFLSQKEKKTKRKRKEMVAPFVLSP
jgi:hypothetical protein